MKRPEACSRSSFAVILKRFSHHSKLLLTHELAILICIRVMLASDMQSEARWKRKGGRQGERGVKFGTLQLA